MSDPLTPSDGARLLLERDRELADGARASYRATIYTPTATFAGHATLGDDGSVELELADAPAELVEALRALAKLTARAAPNKSADGLPAWPARVLRWRGPGRKSERPPEGRP